MILILILTLNRILILKNLCGTTPVAILETRSITFVTDFASGILILILILRKKNLKKFVGTKLNFMSIINM